jgi:hypothetical protein
VAYYGIKGMRKEQKTRLDISYSAEICTRKLSNAKQDFSSTSTVTSLFPGFYTFYTFGSNVI